MITMNEINDHLRIKWGYHLDGQSRFRVVFSDNEYEIDGVTPKYSYIKERWLLEKYFPEFREYCCIWTFSINGQYVVPQIPWLDQLCYLAMASPEEKKRDLLQMEKDELAEFLKRADTLLETDDGVHDMKNQRVNYVRPLFMNLDFELKGKK